MFYKNCSSNSIKAGIILIELIPWLLFLIRVILQPVLNVIKNCLQIIILNFHKTDSTFFIF